MIFRYDILFKAHLVNDREISHIDVTEWDEGL